MSNIVDLLGQRFGRLTITGRAATRYGQTAWSAVCDCGKTLETTGQRLRIGKIKSCGCIRKEIASKGLNIKHGKSGTPAWRSWKAMLDRCENVKDHSYPNYGGRGIHVCERWQEFAHFLADMGERPPGTSLDRYPDNNGNYEPGNCRWATVVQQARNKRTTRYLTANGKTLSLGDWSAITGIGTAVLWARISRGWAGDKAVSTAVQHRGIGHA
jgi:hypothetical protein